jgi:hypothetical protein
MSSAHEGEASKKLKVLSELDPIEAIKREYEQKILALVLENQTLADNNQTLVREKQQLFDDNGGSFFFFYPHSLSSVDDLFSCSDWRYQLLRCFLQLHPEF